MGKAQSYLLDGRYEESAEQITLARLDMEGARDYFNDPAYKRVKPSIDIANDVNDINQQVTSERYIDDIIARLTADIEKAVSLQKLYMAGNYSEAKETIQYCLMGMGDTRTLINSVSHLPGGIDVPDTCTAYTMLNEISASLDKLEVLAQAKDIDAVKYAETLNLVRHDIELGKKVINENRETYWLGLNLKVMRDTNIGIQTALVNLERAKQAQLKTELIAPFDGRVEDINLRAGDMITQRYSTTGAPIDSYIIRLADTSFVRMTGTVDEIDAVKIKSGQKARIFIDAVPGRQFDGTVKFISSYGPLQAGGIQYYGTIQPLAPTYQVGIDIDKQQASGLYAGLSASAEILIDSRPGVLIVPNGAVSGNNGEYTVRVLAGSGTAEQRPVKIGLQTRSQTEIVAGLKEGEKVLVEKISTPTRQLHK
jgi:RND family efflux transporter MFP subunit